MDAMLAVSALYLKGLNPDNKSPVPASHG
jgi:hypothetical protein